MQNAYPTLGGVFPARETVALKSTTETPEHPLVFVNPKSVGEILATEYGSDAHFVSYYPHNYEPGDQFPRCALSVLPEIRAMKPGADLVSSWWVLEQDNPGHQPHTDPKAAIVALRAAWDALDPKPHAAYTTRAGWRFLWALDRPLPVDESASRRLSFAKAVLPGSDPGTNDWTRLWRAPKATREGESLWVQAWFALLIAEASDASRPLIDPTRYAALAPTKASAQPSSARPLDAPQPSHEEAAELLDLLHTPTHMRLLGELRRRAMGRTPLEGIAFKFERIAPPDGPGRSNAIQLAAGQAAAFWTPLAPQVTPEMAYALLWPAAAALNPDADPKGPQDWTRHLWEAITKFWPRSLATVPKQVGTSGAPEQKTFKAIIESTQDTLERQTCLLSQMLSGVEQWANQVHAHFPPHLDGQQGWVQSHVLLVGQNSREIYLMRPDGYFNPKSIQPGSLIPMIKLYGLESIIHIQTGEGRPLTAEAILRDRAKPILEKVVYGGISSNEGQPGGILKFDAGNPVPSLHVSYYAVRRDLEPKFDPEIDAWLKALSGDRYEDLCRWLSYALDFSRPTAALALYGATGVGKKMIAQGLVECLNPERKAGSGNDFGNFNSMLLYTPFLFIDEGFSSHIAKEDRAVKFRTLIDGGSQRIEEKYEASTTAHVPVRILFTMNNTTFIDFIAGGQELTRDDEEAISKRLLIIPALPAGSEYLESRGGRDYTAGWIAPDTRSSATHPSDYKVAKHFLHLYETRHKYERGARLLVQGRPQDIDLFRKLQTRTETGELVAEVLLDLVIMAAEGKPPLGVVYRPAGMVPQQGGHIPTAGFYATRDAIQKQMILKTKHSGEKPGQRARFEQRIRPFSHAPHSEQISSKDRKRYWHIDLQKLLEQIEPSGRDCTHLYAMIDGTLVTPSNSGRLLAAGKSLASILQNNDSGKVN